MNKLKTVAIGVGSNWHDSIANTLPIVDESIALLRKRNVKICSISSYYQTRAFPANSGPDFVNLALVLETLMQPQELLECLHRIEHELGRTRNMRWEQRVIDLDILFYEELVLPNQETHKKWVDLPLSDQKQLTPDQLILPHPRLQDRSFVLIPLREIAPEWIHPVSQNTVHEMCAKFSPEELSEIKRL